MCKVNRWFWKCDECLSVAAVETDLSAQPKVECGCCGGGMSLMGRVERDRLVRDAEVCACDERCTGASGPHCSCHCGGVNHGTGAVVAVMFDQGSIPKLAVVETAAARARAAEYREALATFTSERDAIIRAKSAGWIDQARFDRLRHLGRMLDRARTLRTHSGRMKALRSLTVS